MLFHARTSICFLSRAPEQPSRLSQLSQAEYGTITLFDIHRLSFFVSTHRLIIHTMACFVGSHAIKRFAPPRSSSRSSSKLSLARKRRFLLKSQQPRLLEQVSSQPLPTRPTSQRERKNVDFSDSHGRTADEQLVPRHDRSY